jgi:uncharacterized protein (DUF4415 family)
MRGSAEIRNLPTNSQAADYSANHMKRKTEKLVSYTLDTLPQLTEADIAHLKRLAAMPDSEIDLSDIPELPAEAWKNAVRRLFYRPVKQQITARIDSDVLHWLKSQGKGYQSRMNEVLRREMMKR